MLKRIGPDVYCGGDWLVVRNQFMRTCNGGMRWCVYYKGVYQATEATLNDAKQYVFVCHDREENRKAIEIIEAMEQK